jgi:hypothetical protein
MDNSIDVISGIAVGTFLLTVVVKGNSKALVEQAIADKAFIKWAVAVGILFYLRDVSGLKGPVTLLITAAFIGLFLIAGDKIIPQAKSFWTALGG